MVFALILCLTYEGQAPLCMTQSVHRRMPECMSAMAPAATDAIVVSVAAQIDMTQVSIACMPRKAAS